MEQCSVVFNLYTFPEAQVCMLSRLPAVWTSSDVSTVSTHCVWTVSSGCSGQCVLLGIMSTPSVSPSCVFSSVCLQQQQQRRFLPLLFFCFCVAGGQTLTGSIRLSTITSSMFSSVILIKKNIQLFNEIRIRAHQSHLS